MNWGWGIKKAPVKVEGNLMFSQRDNPYCDLLQKQDKEIIENKEMHLGAIHAS